MVKKVSKQKKRISRTSTVSKQKKVSNNGFNLSRLNLFLILGVAILLSYNQFTVKDISTAIRGDNKFASLNLDEGTLAKITSTAQSIQVVFAEELDEVAAGGDVVSIMIPTGTPEYADVFENKISFDDPVNSLDYLAGEAYPKLKAYVQQNEPEVWERYINLGTKPVGISCEFCCGIGPVGITKDGAMRCGCKHNPAVQAITLGLMSYTEYSDAQILKEVMKWKTIFYPKNMIDLSLKVAGGDPNTLKDLPGMVGGC